MSALKRNPATPKELDEMLAQWWQKVRCCGVFVIIVLLLVWRFS